MKLTKDLNDFPQFIRIRTAVEALRTEKGQVSARLDQIAFELSRPKQPQVDSESAWKCALEGEGTVRSQYAADNRSELRDELLELEGRARFIDEALSVGVMELDKARGQASLEICATVRPQWTEQIKIILDCLKKISAANVTLDTMRAELERNGVVTGALPHSTFDIGGRWNDEFGGRVTAFQGYVSEMFPEVADAAAQDVKLKIKALVERERKFAARFEQEGVSE